MKITSDNYPRIIRHAFEHADLGTRSINKIVEYAEGELNYAMEGVDDDDYITKIIVNAIESKVGDPDLTMYDTINDLDYAIKQLQIARTNLQFLENMSESLNKK